ncbi:MAG: hypothetical protein AUJ49_11015 [Desulfovibrionaceae bacterium CG1_02_65_16]|nr:MAG: hypothetical protein AUJ49_11015 [Desulfovibrionaceae bacterium CG1_02_65_16]
MLLLLPAPKTAKTNTPAAQKNAATCAVRPSALVYTLLRHGRSLPRVEAEQRLRESLDTLAGGEPDFDGPFQAA